MSCGVCQRHGSDPTLLWLWYRPAAIALSRHLAWELPYAVDVALKSKKNKNKNKINDFIIMIHYIIVTWDIIMANET